MAKIWKTVAAVFFLCISFLFFQELFFKLPDGKVKIVFLPVNEGESMYIKTPHGKEIFIDGGIDMAVLYPLSQHRLFWDKTIDFIIITHPDADHYYGAIEVLKRNCVQTLIITGVLKNDPKYAELFDRVEKCGGQVVFAHDKSDFIIDGVFFDIIYPFYSLYASSEMTTNNTSLVIRMSYFQHSILLTGDIESDIEEQILKTPLSLKADILKVPHHGSRTSSSVGFLQAVDPSLAIVNAGANNRFNHPHEDILTRYADLHIPVRSTKQEGTIVIEWEK